MIRSRFVMGLAATLMVVASCSDDAGTRASSSRDTTTTTAAGSAPSTTTTPSAGPLRIMVTNDDGVSAAGIDAVVTALRALPNTEVTVVAPAAQQSGSGGKTTPGTLSATPATTASGLPATAVNGYPADTVIWALDQGGLPERPQLVVSGVNEGQNLGPVVNVSGTIGAARAAVARGIPALAASQGMGDSPTYEVAVGYVVDWVTAHRAALSAGSEPVAITSINAPTCGSGSVRGLLEVPTATDPAGRNVLSSDVDCASSSPAGADDLGAFNVGYATISPVPATA